MHSLRPRDAIDARRPALTHLARAFPPYVVLSITHVVLLTLDHPAAVPTKILLMPLLALPVIIVSRRIAPRSALALLSAAMLFSWLGDSVGVLFPAAPELPLMLALFGLAHLAYIALFTRHLAERRLPIWTIVYVAWWAAMMITLGPHVGNLLIALALYGAVLAGTAAFSARCRPLIAIGGAFFLASDTVLAFRLFLPEVVNPWGSPVVMLTYTLGQGLIIAGAIITLSRRKPS